MRNCDFGLLYSENWNLSGCFVGNGFIRSEMLVNIHGSVVGIGFQFLQQLSI